MRKLSGFVVASAVVMFSAVEQSHAQNLDDNFLIEAAKCQHAEIELSKVATSRANTKAVKDFAEMMVKDHKAGYDKLAGLLKNRKIGIVAGTEKETRAAVSRLKELEGAAFDREYLKMMVSDHKKAIAVFEAQAEKGKENDIKDYAKDALPTLRAHLKKAEELAKTTSQ